MSMETIFSLINLSVMPAWLLLILAPKWSVTKTVVHSMLYPIVLGFFYTIGLFLAVFGGMGAEGGGFSSIAQVRTLFSTDIGILIGWSHYLVFDLFVGAWEARDAQKRGIKHWLVIPCLFLTFMAGPFGLLLYFVLRSLSGRTSWALDKSDDQRSI